MKYESDLDWTQAEIADDLLFGEAWQLLSCLVLDNRSAVNNHIQALPPDVAAFERHLNENFSSYMVAAVDQRALESSRVDGF